MRKPRRLSLEELAPYLWQPPTDDSPLHWPDLFGNSLPVEIEVGCGKGAFLVAIAPEHPETNFLGIEIVRKYQLYTATRIGIRKLPNVKLTCTDARILLRDRVPVGTVQAIHVYFPDPWWKKRHHKRRVFTAEFVSSCARILQPQGRLYLATDVAEYFTIITDLCRAEPRLEAIDAHALNTVTNFERKAQLDGTPIHRAAYQRLPE